MLRVATCLSCIGFLMAAPVSLAEDQSSPANVPSNALLDDRFEVKTAWPYPAENSGSIEYRPHGRDLRQWLTLSYDDLRGIPEPATVEFEGPITGDAKRGEVIFTTTAQGNCVACHHVEGIAQTGTVGPSLEEYAARGMPDSYIYQMIYDARVYFPGTLMPPFGALNNLSDQQIHDVMAFLATLK